MVLQDLLLQEIEAYFSNLELTTVEKTTEEIKKDIQTLVEKYTIIKHVLEPPNNQLALEI